MHHHIALPHLSSCLAFQIRAKLSGSIHWLCLFVHTYRIAKGRFFFKLSRTPFHQLMGHYRVKALEVHLTDEQTAVLDELTTPQLPFPLPFLRMAPSLHAGGTTINGEPSQLWQFSPTSREDHY